MCEFVAQNCELTVNPTDKTIPLFSQVVGIGILLESRKQNSGSLREQRRIHFLHFRELIIK